MTDPISILITDTPDDSIESAVNRALDEAGAPPPIVSAEDICKQTWCCAPIHGDDVPHTIAPRRAMPKPEYGPARASRRRW